MNGATPSGQRPYTQGRWFIQLLFKYDLAGQQNSFKLCSLIDAQGFMLKQPIILGMSDAFDSPKITKRLFSSTEFYYANVHQSSAQHPPAFLTFASSFSRENGPPKSSICSSPTSQKRVITRVRSKQI